MAKKKKKSSRPTTTGKQKKVAQAILANRGTSVSAAMREAGYSDAYAKNPQQLTTTKSWKELMEEFLPEDELAAVHKSLLNSKRVERLILHKDTPDEDIKEMIKSANCTLKKIYIFMGEKHVMFWTPNDKSRSDALDMAYKLKGNYAPQKMQVERKLQDLTDEELEQLIEEEGKKIAK